MSKIKEIQDAIKEFDKQKYANPKKYDKYFDLAIQALTEKLEREQTPVKKCSNCNLKDSNGNLEPCKSCLGVKTVLNNWTPIGGAKP